MTSTRNSKPIKIYLPTKTKSMTTSTKFMRRTLRTPFIFAGSCLRNQHKPNLKRLKRLNKIYLKSSEQKIN